jgi:hypothetical protein
MIRLPRKIQSTMQNTAGQRSSSNILDRDVGKESMFDVVLDGAEGGGPSALGELLRSSGCSRKKR